MQQDSVRYWQDLTQNYRRMSDGELLALRPEDLTEIAQQVLRDEMRLRKLNEITPNGAVEAPTRFRSKGHRDALRSAIADSYIGVEPDDSDEDADDEDDEPAHEYTWKTLLCDCESNDRAWQLREALKRHGIESWVSAVAPSSVDVVGPQVYVAADELDQAQAIAAQPIPQDIIDDWNTHVPEFEVPRCPRCGSSEEVLLEATEPANAWLCESCGAEWTDPEPPAEDAQRPKSSGL